MCFRRKKRIEQKEEAIKTKEEKNEKDIDMKEERSVKNDVDSKEEATNQEKHAKKGVYRVVYDKEDNLWKIKKDGAKRVIDSKKTKEEALKRVQELSQSQDVKFVVYKKDGKFQKKANLKLKND